MSSFKTLADLKLAHQKATISGFTGDSHFCDRLKELGIHLGVEVIFVGGAPLGGPRLFRFGNTVLALRKEEAACAIIQS